MIIIRILFSLCFTSFILLSNLFLFKSILFSNHLTVYSNFKLFNFILEDFQLWNTFKLIYIIVISLSSIIFSNIIYSKFIQKFFTPLHLNNSFNISKDTLNLLVGKTEHDNFIYIPEKSLYQNILITGGIGTGKTASAMYPFTKQLISYMHSNSKEKLGFLILDVKGNYYSKVLEFATKYNRVNDVIVIELNGKYTYNPLDKPNLKASILANRLKTILLLFSPNNSESYWLDKAQLWICYF